MLLGNIRENPPNDSKVGVVPKDLGLRLISDLIEDIDVGEFLNDGIKKKKNEEENSLMSFCWY